MAKLKLVKKISRAPGTVWRFIWEARDELKKVSWPTREVATRYTISVVIASIAVGVVTGALDYILTQILEKIIN